MRSFITRVVPIALFLIAATAGSSAAGVAFDRVDASQSVSTNGHQSRACSMTTQDARRACNHEVADDFWIAIGKCRNFADDSERSSCKDDAVEERWEGRTLCGEQQEVREFICEEIGEDPYDPQIDPSDFSSVVDNPLSPYLVGTKWTFEGDTDEGHEVIIVEVLDETRDVMGVECIVVRDQVFLEGDLIEDTADWYAQDLEGNVWYFGEISYELEDGVILGLEGSWEAGVDGAKPGIVMPANPVVGQLYRQEYLLGEAEDVALVEALDQSIDVVFGSFDGAVQTREFLPIDPDALEFKYYVPGIGFALEIKPETGERLELVDMVTN